MARSKAGIQFETYSRRVEEALPRMDIAAFVGFSASGPLNLPVAIEDYLSFKRIFGEDVVLARNEKNNELVYAQLGPTVRSFFREGGKKCWVIRVAKATASHNYYPLPGMLRLLRNATGETAIEPAFARARSEGSWSDNISISTAARFKLIPAKFDETNLGIITHVDIVGNNVETKNVSDSILQLRFVNGQQRFWLYALATINNEKSKQEQKFYDLNPSVCFTNLNEYLSEFQEYEVNIELYKISDAERGSCFFNLEHPENELASELEKIRSSAILIFKNDRDSLLKIHKSHVDKSLIRTGVWIKIILGESVVHTVKEAWFYVSETKLVIDEYLNGSPIAVENALYEQTGRLYWLVTPDSDYINELSLYDCLQVNCDIRVTGTNRSVNYLRDLSLSPDQNRCLSAMVGDHGRYYYHQNNENYTYRKELRRNGFPLSIVKNDVIDETMFYLPIELSQDFSPDQEKMYTDKAAAFRNGLEEFDSHVFFDTELASATTKNLINEADRIRYSSSQLRPLCGMHAILGYAGSRINEEVSLVALPDAIHNSWKLEMAEQNSIHLSANNDTSGLQEKVSGFEECETELFTAPQFKVKDSDFDYVHCTLSWDPFPQAWYTLEESLFPDFEDSSISYFGKSNYVNIIRPRSGAYFYRVKAEVDGKISEWSETLKVVIRERQECKQTEVINQKNLSKLHAGLLAMCASSASLFAILTLPQKFIEKDITSYLAQLIDELKGERHSNIPSYGAIYFPWVVSLSDQGKTITQTPEGAVTGNFSKLAIAHGAWIAPANNTYQTVLGLSKILSTDLLSDLPLNCLLARGTGVVVLSAFTLQKDSQEYELITIRRLLILLRRLAFKYGATYVFEPNSNQLCRQIKNHFELIMDDLYDRGALAGDLPTNAYQVVTSNALNSSYQVDQGRLLIELRVRPSYPMEFISVRILQNGSSLAVVEGLSNG